MAALFGARRLEELLRRVAGLNIDKSDVKRVTDLLGKKLNDLLIVGVRNASYNRRDVVMPPDLPLTLGFLESIKEFKKYDEEIELQPILEHLATYPPLERELSVDVEQMLPEIAGALLLIAARTIKTIDPGVKNPDTAMWERVEQIMDLTL